LKANYALHFTYMFLNHKELIHESEFKAVIIDDQTI
jgi:hypothetical protein